MGATARISILSLCCFVGILYYYLVNIMVLTSDRCWKLSEFWFEDSHWITPYWSFSAFFTIAFLWLVAEFHSLLANRSKVVVKASMLLVAFIFIAMCGVMQTSLWQSLEVLDGKRNADDFWPKLREFARPHYTNRDDEFFLLPWRQQEWILDQELRSRAENGYPLSWSAFVWEKTCMRGVEVALISDEQWNSWVHEHYEMFEQFYGEQDKKLIRENLLRAYALPSESGASVDNP